MLKTVFDEKAFEKGDFVVFREPAKDPLWIHGLVHRITPDRLEILVDLGQVHILTPNEIEKGTKRIKRVPIDDTLYEREDD